MGLCPRESEYINLNSKHTNYYGVCCSLFMQNMFIFLSLLQDYSFVVIVVFHLKVEINDFKQVGLSFYPRDENGLVTAKIWKIKLLPLI